MSPGAKLVGIEAGNELKGELAGKFTLVGMLSPSGGCSGIGVEGSGAIAGVKMEEATGKFVPVDLLHICRRSESNSIMPALQRRSKAI